MKILIVGSGGREHAIAWKVAQSRKAEKIYCAPGNAGIAEYAECVDIGAMEFERLSRFAKEKEIDLTIIGMDDPLVGGVVDVSWFCEDDRIPSVLLAYQGGMEGGAAVAALLTGRRDFTSFSKLHTDVKTNICDLRRARWHCVDEAEGRWYFEIAADRFLRNMVRAVVGTLIDVGRGKISPEEVLSILERKDRCAAGTSMPGEALFLWSVKYPYL